MRGVPRIVLLVGLIALAPVLAGCESFDTEKFDIFALNEKKKLPGERKEVFPEGVPGVAQGLPPEYQRKKQDGAPPAVTAGGTPEGAATLAQPDKTAAVAPVEEPKPKAKPKRKPKPQTTARPAAQPVVQPAAQRQDSGQQQPAPWPAPSQAQSPAPAQGQTMAPWPSAPPPGTFSR